MIFFWASLIASIKRKACEKTGDVEHEVVSKLERGITKDRGKVVQRGTQLVWEPEGRGKTGSLNAGAGKSPGDDNGSPH